MQEFYIGPPPHTTQVSGRRMTDITGPTSVADVSLYKQDHRSDQILCSKSGLFEYDLHLNCVFVL